jgi:hypothetical protein
LEQVCRQPKSPNPAGDNLRDQAMGENLAWLAKEYYPDRKIIVWAASRHLMRGGPGIQWLEGTGSYAETVATGDVAHRLLGEDYYSVMFTAWRGKKGYPMPFPWCAPADIPKVPQGSLEDLLHGAAVPYAFVDFRSLPPGGQWLRQPLVARPMGYSPMRADWPAAFDAVFYAEEMFPSTRSGDVPQTVRTAKRSESYRRIAETLEQYRKTLVGYDLGLGYSEREWKSYDPGRLKNQPNPTGWPEGLVSNLRMETNPDSFTVVGRQQGKRTIRYLSGPQALTVPLNWSMQTEGSATLLLLDGIARDGDLTATSRTSLVCRGPMAGGVQFLSWAATLVQGDLSGSVTGYSAFDLVVTGKCSGQIIARSNAMIYLLGGCQGSVTLNGSRVYIAGRLDKVDLPRIAGRGEVFLERSDLPAGRHKIRDLTITVGKHE